MSEKVSIKTAASVSFYSLIQTWVGAILFLGILSIPSILHMLPGALSIKDLPTNASVSSVVRPAVEQMSNIPHIATITTFIFWCLAGSIVYITGVTLYGLIFTAKNDMDEAMHYIFPMSVKRSSVIQSLLLNWTVFAMLLVISASLLISTVILWLPICRELFMSGFRQPASIVAWLHTIAASLTLAVLLSAVLFLARLVRRSFSVL